MKQRLEWLSLLRGLTILLVVMFHVQLIDKSTGENHAFCETISYPFRLVRMPTFIFVSGGLLYLSRIKSKWSVVSLYLDMVAMDSILAYLITFIRYLFGSISVPSALVYLSCWYFIIAVNQSASGTLCA